MSPAVRASIALGLMAGFYMLAVASGVGMLAIAWLGIQTQSAATAKFAFLAAVAGGTVLWSLRPRRDNFEAPGPELTREEQPELFAVLDEVARATNQAMPKQVYALQDVNAWVSTRGGVLGIGGRRVMGLGIPLLHLLTVDQLKAVLAHEFGHYGGGDTKIGRVVYQTRMGLVRTLEAVDGKAIAVLFNVYGKFVMRISTAVARHEEFAADKFAAQVTSGQDLIDSLHTIDKFAPLFPFFFFSNVIPVTEEGYWPPIGEGFAKFCASPVLAEATVTVSAAPSAAGHDADADAIADGGMYDSHPSTSARELALNAFRLYRTPDADTRVAGSLIRRSSQLEAELFHSFDRKLTKLKPVEWADVTDRVLIPRWQRVARENSSFLKNIQIESPPTTTKELVQMGRIAGGSKARDKDNLQVQAEAAFAIACAVMNKLLDAGWRPEPAPSFGCEFVRADERVDPVRKIREIAEGSTPVADWAKFCQAQGFSGPLAS